MKTDLFARDWDFWSVIEEPVAAVRKRYAVPGLDPRSMIGQDAMYIALEDESGYLKISTPQGRWKPGRYRVEIHAGEQVNEMSLMGTMRFTVAASDEP